jgi:hypothetical protein
MAQAVLFEVEAWCANCPSHIPQVLPVGEVAAALAGLQQRVRELEVENAARGPGSLVPARSRRGTS